MDVTICNICNALDFSISTFYNRMKNKYDLLHNTKKMIKIQELFCTTCHFSSQHSSKIITGFKTGINICTKYVMQHNLMLSYNYC